MPGARSPRSRQAAGLGEAPRRHEKNATPEGEGRRTGKGLVPAGRLEHATHEPLISSVIVAEVPLAGLSLTELAKARLDASDGSDTHTLVRGLLKTYSTAGNMVWYSGVRDQLQKVVTPLAASSPKATAEASAAIQVWLKEAPKEENDAVFGGMHRVNAGDVTKRLAELTGKKP